MMPGNSNNSFSYLNLKCGIGLYSSLDLGADILLLLHANKRQ
jgi:hypothetical protein